MEVNKYQTALTDDLIKSLTKEEYENLFDYINNVPFIQSLISPDRKYARDLPRKDGRIIVDVCHPHILEDMEYFRPAGNHYKKYGCYTKLRPNGNPNSEFGKWIRQELDRIWNGYVRPSDGEWVTGDFYFYINYCPIMVSRTKGDNSKVALRVSSFPEIWEANYLWFHYIDQARHGGLYNDWIGGQHAVLIARRGVGKAQPYSLELDTPQGRQVWRDIKVGDLLYNELGGTTKVLEIHEQGVIPIYKINFADGRSTFACLDHLWEVKIKGKTEVWDTRTIINRGFSPRKDLSRVPSGVEARCSIPINKAIQMPRQTIPIDPYTLGVILGDGCLRTYYKNNVSFTCHPDDLSNYKQNIPYEIVNLKDKYSHNIRIDNIHKDLKDLNLDFKLSKDKFIPKCYLYNSIETRLELLKGLMDTDGSCSKEGHVEFTSKSKALAEDITWLARSLGIRASLREKKIIYKGEERIYYRVHMVTILPIFKLDRKLANWKKRNSNRLKNQAEYVTITSIDYSHNELAKCVTVDNPTNLYLTNDFIVTHNSYSAGALLAKIFTCGESLETSKEVTGLVTAYEKEYLTKDGILNKFVSMADFCAENTQFPSARYKNSLADMNWIMGYMDANSGIIKGTKNEIIGFSSKDNPDKGRGKRAHKLIFEEFGRFPQFLNTWNTSDYNVREGEYAFGQLLAFGTGGCVCAGTQVFTATGDLVNIEKLRAEDGILGYDLNNNKVSIESISNLRDPALKPCLKIITNSGRELSCSIDHPIYSSNKLDVNGCRTWNWYKAEELSVGDTVAVCNTVEAAREIALKKKRWRKQLFDYEKIVKIENIGLQPIYNLTASNTHTYLANGIITHNTEGSDFSGALELIYHPDGYGTYAIPNVFDKNSQGKTKTVFFLGAYMNRKGYYNSDGVSDVIGALLSEIRDRIRIKYNSSDAMALTQRKAEMAITIQEAIMKRDNTIYPVADLNDRLNEIDFNPHHFDDLWIGRLAIKDGAVVYKPDTDVDYIKNFPHKDNKLEGAICIKAMPETDSSGNIPTGRYIAGIDPYDDDVSNTMSLGALYILDLFTDELVFEYVGRPTFADDFYEICRKALLFYNAECNYENNKKGLFKYFSQHNCLYLLSDTLEFLRDKEMIRGNLYGNKNKGVNATEPIKAYARRCIRDWLLKPTETNKILENGEVEETTSLNLFKIPYRALIQELSQWNSDANFDRHDALGMLMLLREDKLRLIGEGDVKSSIEDDPNYLGNDPFFSQSKKGVKFKFSF